MKTKLIIILFTSLLGCDQCDHDPPLTELEKLPPATQEGKNTFGCLVNGKAWVTKTSIDAAAFYQGGLLSIGADNAKLRQSLGLSIRGTVESIRTSTFHLGNGLVATAEFAGIGPLGICIYASPDILNGSISITNIDTHRLIVSGLFEFTTATEKCDTICVTDGRFDLTYAP